MHVVLKAKRTRTQSRWRRRKFNVASWRAWMEVLESVYRDMESRYGGRGMGLRGEFGIKRDEGQGVGLERMGWWTVDAVAGYETEDVFG